MPDGSRTALPFQNQMIFFSRKSPTKVNLVGLRKRETECLGSAQRLLGRCFNFALTHLRRFAESRFGFLAAPDPA